MKTTYTVWGTGAAKNSALTNADGADHIAVRIADEHGFVHLSQQPGLGDDIHFEYIAEHTVAQY